MKLNYFDDKTFPDALRGFSRDDSNSKRVHFSLSKRTQGCLRGLIDKHGRKRADYMIVQNRRPWG